jgi:hypothetical protein
VKRVLTTALAAALVLIAVAAAIAARERLTRRAQGPTRTPAGELVTALPKRHASEPDRGDESFVQWIPIMVPLFALLLVVLVYLIAIAVL